jgi:MFS family permease
VSSDPGRRPLVIGTGIAGLYVALRCRELGLRPTLITKARLERLTLSVAVFAAGCGLAKTFPQLALMRMGVGVGEASLSPAAYSLITDYFPPRLRGLAQGVYNAGIHIGSGAALMLGGAIALVRRQA